MIPFLLIFKFNADEVLQKTLASTGADDAVVLLVRAR